MLERVYLIAYRANIIDSPILIRVALIVWRPTIEHGAHLYRLRDGTHRFYASRTLGFSHVPAEICEVY